MSVEPWEGYIPVFSFLEDAIVHHLDEVLSRWRSGEFELAIMHGISVGFLLLASTDTTGAVQKGRYAP